MRATRSASLAAVMTRIGAPLHWVGMAVALVVLGTAAAVGSRLIDAAGRAPGAIEGALLAQNETATALGIVANLEADRRAYQLTGMREHLAALAADHDRIHETLRRLRESLGAFPALAGHVEASEQAVGSWRDEFESDAASGRSARTLVERDRALLGAARNHLGQVSSAVESVLRVERQRVSGAHARAQRLWLVVTMAALVAIVLLAELARLRQRRLLRSARDMELLLEALPFAIISLDRDGIIRHATDQARALFGLSTGTLIGRRLPDFIVALDRPAMERSVERAANGAAVACEAQVRTGVDVPRVLSFTLAPIVEPGEQVGVTAVARDATAERALKTQTRESDRLARIGTIATAVAHELNRALTSIMDATAPMNGGRLETADRAALETVRAEAQRAARTVRTIMDFSRHDAHRHEPQRIRDVLERAVALRRFDARSGDVEFRLDVPPDVPPVMGDTQELLEAFLNLLVNAEYAVRNQDRRCVTIDVRVERHRILVGVTDTGPGIPDDKLEAVFQPFYTTKPHGEGVGLGLALARGVVVEHQGSIWAERAPDGGARFVVALPVIPTPRPDSATTDLPVGQASGRAAEAVTSEMRHQRRIPCDHDPVVP